MNKICPRCGKVYSYSVGSCPNQCSSKARTEANRVYDRCQRDNSSFYNSREWKKLRESCKNRYSGLCVWSLYKHKRIIKGTTAHHIVPLSQDRSKGMELNNLVYLSDGAHREVHRLYDIDQRETIEQLKQFIVAWMSEHGMGGTN
ncbi:MAG: hypothetical protein ACRCW9_05535 [Cetobacterium sp.]